MLFRSWQETFTPPSKSAIFQARARLGSKPLEALFARVAKPIGTAGMSGVWLAGRRLVAIDGGCLDVADTPVNAEFFGRPGVSKGEKAAFPQARRRHTTSEASRGTWDSGGRSAPRCVDAVAAPG